MKIAAAALAVLLLSVPHLGTGYSEASLPMQAPAVMDSAGQQQAYLEGYRSWRTDEADFRDSLRQRDMAQADITSSR
jgi:hypothetical protein